MGESGRRDMNFSKRRNLTPFVPLCTFCGEKVQRTPIHYLTPDSTMPTGVHRRVCSPGCPQRPKGTTVTEYEPNWWKQGRR
jgi:hypothetical protein